MANKNLTAAKKAKNDEFYTQMPDIEKELCHYKQHFVGKTIFCNCDDPTWSNFWRYFHLNFEHFKLKKLISTHYDPKKPTYKMEYEGGNDTDYEVGTITPLQQNGDFRSPECIELLKEADIVVTNPPFSLFREYVAQLMEYGKKFVIIGNMNAVTYKEIFPLIKDNRAWLGVNAGDMAFRVPADTEPRATRYWEDKTGQKWRSMGNVIWFTNLDIPKRHELIDLIERYSPERYPRYDNYDAINVDKTLDIPCDYEPCWYKCPHAESCTYAKSEGKIDEALCEQNESNNASSLTRGGTEDSTHESLSARRKCNGIMGVPISFLDKYCPEQFTIIGVFNHGKDGPWDFAPCIVCGVEKYKRLAIVAKM